MANVKRFRKLPVEIDAVELRADNADAVASWCGGRAIHDPKASDPTDVYVGVDIPTLEGVMRASVGDQVIRGVQGEFYPCKADIFAATYEEVPGDEPTPVVPICSLCRRERTLQDAYDYNPLQAITGQPLGWYSGDDGEVCPECMAETMGRQN